MRNRIIKILAASTLAAIAIVPSVGSANDLEPIPHASVGDVQCALTLAEGNTCSETFFADQPGSVSMLQTHGNFHTLSPVAGGSVTVTWLDGAGEVVFVATCSQTGLFVEGTGPLDLTDALCSNEIAKDTYIEGTQTMLVVADAPEGTDPTTEFHGRLVVNGSGDLI